MNPFIYAISMSLVSWMASLAAVASVKSATWLKKMVLENDI